MNHGFRPWYYMRISAMHYMRVANGSSGIFFIHFAIVYLLQPLAV